jgi:hypothetical protein
MKQRKQSASLVKASGIAVLYASAAIALCMTVQQCLWEPFCRFRGGDSLTAWPEFTRSYTALVQLITAFVAYLAARSARYGFATATLSGVAAALLFRLAERVDHSINYRPGILFTLLTASALGLSAALLANRHGAQLHTSPNGGPASRLGDSGVDSGPPSVS